MLNRNKTTKLSAMVVGLVALFSAGSSMAASPLDPSIAIEKTLVESSHKSQQKIDRFAEQTVEMLAEYKDALRVIESLKIYNAQLEALIENQEQELVTIQDEIDNIDETERGVAPLMNEMIASLERFIQLDLPFKQKERLERVGRLRNNMLRADAATAEKYRSILAAYDAEIKYGEGYEAYTGDIETPTGNKQVEFLRFGRVILVFLTLDGTEAGYWNSDLNKFEALGDEYLRPIEQGIKMANKQTSLDLIKLPVPAVKGAQ